MAELLPSAHFTLLGRDPDRMQELGRLLNAAPARSMKALLDKCDLIITATPSVEALFDANDAREGQHFVGVGADGREKREIPERLYSRANMIVTDDHSQCLDLSDFGRAVRAGQVAADADATLGHVLSGARSFNRRPSDISDITVADLTRLAAQDIAIANLFLGKLADAVALQQLVKTFPWQHEQPMLCRASAEVLVRFDENRICPEIRAGESSRSWNAHLLRDFYFPNPTSFLLESDTSSGSPKRNERGSNQRNDANP